MRDDYVALIRHVVDHGVKVKPRGQVTLELRNVSFRLENPYDSFAVGIGRGMNVAIAASEAAQLIGGVTYPELMKKVQPNFEQFMDDGTLHGAYGPRIKHSLPQIERRLREDPDTRQAQVSIWNNEFDLFGESVDLPCTTALRFFIRNNKLELDVTMRSSDVVWGLTYDLVQFTQLQLTMANVLGLRAGPYHHHAASLHFYLRDLKLLNKLHPFEKGDLTGHPKGFTGPTFEVAAHQAREILKLDFKDRFLTTETQRWYWNQLKKFM